MGMRHGPEVIESEAGIAEFDPSDHALVWSINGGAHRRPCAGGMCLA
jgi:malonate decarboxylase beta subunit